MKNFGIPNTAVDSLKVESKESCNLPQSGSELMSNVLPMKVLLQSYCLADESDAKRFHSRTGQMR